MKQLIMAIGLILYANAATAFSYTLELPESELQERVDAMMPLKKKKYLVTATFTKPIIDLIETTNEIGLATNVKVKAPGNLTGNGMVAFTGALRYDSKSGAFFFDNIDIVSLTISKVSEKTLPKIKKVVEFIAQKYLARKPVFSFNDKELKHKLAKSKIKSVFVQDQKLIIELGLF